MSEKKKTKFKKISILNINVGVLGHVDSGKTSLVRSLSTMFSTASNDKSRASKERGMTLDLGFSGLMLPMPFEHKDFKKLQLTFVDCPGHASLIKTVIGGAHIIDMMILVVNVVKGFQAQTNECLVIGEITTDKMIVVLNKVDLLPEEERARKIEEETRKIKERLSKTCFADAPIVAVSAHVGGMGKDDSVGKKIETIGVNKLIDTMRSFVELPDRSNAKESELFFSVDHCFQIKGQGTVLTGTVVRGAISIGQIVEITSHLKEKKKIKSIQMFRKPVQRATQGDRVGVCVAGLNPKTVERGIVAAPDTVPLINGALCLIRKVRFFRHKCLTDSLFHVTIGHTTVMARATFFGTREMMMMMSNETDDDDSRLPRQDYDFEKEYSYQAELLGSKFFKDKTITSKLGPMGQEPLQWVLLRFEKATQCQLNSIMIGSRLDIEDDVKTCRLAFYGRLIRPIDVKDLSLLSKFRIYKEKIKRGVVEKIDKKSHGTAYVKHLFASEVPPKHVLGLKVFTEKTNDLGIVKGLYGNTGLLRVQFASSLTKKKILNANDGVILKLRRYIFEQDRTKHLNQDWLEDVTFEDDDDGNDEEEMDSALESAMSGIKIVERGRGRGSGRGSSSSIIRGTGRGRGRGVPTSTSSVTVGRGRGRGRGVVAHAPSIGRGRGRGRGRGQ